MKHKATWAILIIFLALSAYLVFFDIPKEKKEIEQKEKAEKLFDFLADQVLQVETFSPKSHFLFQKNPEEKWMVKNIPLQNAVGSPSHNVSADPQVVDEIIQKVHELRTSRLVDEKGDDLKYFGFVTPEKSMVVTLKNNSTLKLLIGDEGALSQTLYVKRGDSGKVYLAGADIKSVIEKDFWELSNKHLVSFDQGAIDQIEVKSPKSSWALVKKGIGWRLTDRPNQTVDEAKISSFLFQVGSLEGEKVLSEEAKNLKEYGLDPPLASLKFQAKEKAYLLLIGEKNRNQEKQDEWLTALGDSSGPIFQIKKEFLDKIPAKEGLISTSK